MNYNFTDKQLIKNALELLNETVCYIPHYESNDYTQGYIEATKYAIKIVDVKWE